MKGANYGVFLLVFVVLSHAYKELSVESPELCSPNTKKRIKLASGQRSGLVVKQKRLGDHAIEWLQNSVCKFEVRLDHRARKGEGIFAVVQQIVFRKDEVTGECIDYVQFKRQDGVFSKRLCGRSNAALSMDSVFLNEDDSEEEHMRIASNSFDDPFGELDVYIFVAKEALESNEETDISIVFTAYKACSSVYGPEYLPCSEENNDKCIYSGFFRDGYYNCPYMDCLDEGDCSYMLENTTPVEKESIGNKVLISSVTSLLIMFILFICCIYMCRKYGTLCWAEEFARSTPAATQSPPRNIQLTSTVSETVTAATAPEQATSTAASAPAADDKDLPPSYESLFPTR